MEKSVNYDNFLNSFKKKLWDKCLENKIFNGIPQTEINNVKSIFENNIENYKTQIMQDNNLGSLTDVLLNQIGKDAQLLKTVTSQQLKNANKDILNNALKVKQSEYDSLVKKPLPKTPDFSDGTKDEPLDDNNLESLIQQHMKEREMSININPNNKESIQTPVLESNPEENQVVMTNQFSEQPDMNLPLKNENYAEMIPKIHSDIINLQQIVSNLENVINKQNTILNSIVNSQITILKKI